MLVNTRVAFAFVALIASAAPLTAQEAVGPATPRLGVAPALTRPARPTLTGTSILDSLKYSG